MTDQNRKTHRVTIRTTAGGDTNRTTAFDTLDMTHAEFDRYMDAMIELTTG